MKLFTIFQITICYFKNYNFFQSIIFIFLKGNTKMMYFLKYFHYLIIMTHIFL